MVDEEWSGNIFNEVIVQYTAERIYNEKYHIVPKVKEYLGAEIRMSPNVKAVSNMKNYQMYDYVVSCFLDLIRVSKDELTRKQFTMDNHLLEYLEEKYNVAMEEVEKIDSKSRIPYGFREKFSGEYNVNGEERHMNHTKEGLIDFFDYLYIADVLLYTQPENSKKLKEGELLHCSNATGKKSYPIQIKYENQIYQTLLYFFTHCLEILRSKRETKVH